MRYFTMSDLFGPFQCEHPNCNKLTCIIRLTDEENSLLPQKFGPEAAMFILQNKLGTAVCKNHN